MSLSTDVTVGDPGHAGLHNAERTAINAKPDDFTDLGDAPSSLNGQQGKTVRVNTGETALEFVEPAAAAVRTVNVQTDDYTLVLADAAKAVEMDKATANDLTIPPNSSVAFPVGTLIPICQVGAGQTTVVAGSGVTIDSPETLLLAGQWSTVWARKRATDSWVLSGDLEASP